MWISLKISKAFLQAGLHTLFFLCYFYFHFYICNYTKFLHVWLIKTLHLFHFSSHLSSTATSPATPSCAAFSWPSAAGCCRRSEVRRGPRAATRAPTHGPAARGKEGCCCCCCCQASPPLRRMAAVAVEVVGAAVEEAGEGERRWAGAVRGKWVEGGTRQPPAPQRGERHRRQAAVGAGPRALAGPRWSPFGRRPPGCSLAVPPPPSCAAGWTSGSPDPGGAAPGETWSVIFVHFKYIFIFLVFFPLFLLSFLTCLKLRSRSRVLWRSWLMVVFLKASSLSAFAVQRRAQMMWVHNFTS